MHLDAITGFEDYANEYCVCNAVKVLQLLKYPKNKEGMEFLFICLWDLDEAYFSLAADVLAAFPKDILEKELEERAKLYHESEDALRLAGILFLAKKIKYDIRYVEEVKNGMMPSSGEESAPAESTEEFTDTLPSSLTGSVETTDEGVARFVAVSSGAPVAFETES